jgi:non-ribosomal peptide synthetase component F
VKYGEQGFLPLVEVTADHPAYVIYTSGSTGRPKGVEITHGALLNFIGTASNAFALGGEDRVLQFASISFDAAVEEIFPSLIRGAALVLRTDSMLDSVSLFLERCRDWQITVLDLPTAYWHEVTETLYREKLSLPKSIRLVIIGGERALAERLSQWQASVGNRVRLLNSYGPTETTVVSTMWELAACESPASLGDVPIGRPIPNVQTYILDKRLNLTPIGVYGELYGYSLARLSHYPELTAEKFPNPSMPRRRATLQDRRFGRYSRTATLSLLAVPTIRKIRGFHGPVRRGCPATHPRLDVW